MKDPKNIIILSLLLLLLVSGGLNVWQNKVRKAAEFQAMLDLANSNTTISTKESEIAMRQATIDSIRKDRSKDSLQSTMSQAAFKAQIGILRLKIAKLPKVINYNPDSSTVDSLRTAFFLKDSVIDTQQLMIINLEIEKSGIINSFYKEIRQLEDQRSAQVDISNQLQQQLVASQAEARKQVRKKKVWRFIAGVGVAAAGVLLLSPK